MPALFKIPIVMEQDVQIIAMLLALQQPAVVVPRMEAAVTVDGELSEDVWARAGRITGFSQYEPMDGRAAEQATEVRVWYAPDAIHFGIIVTDADPSSIRATRADRDNIGDDDNVTIHLDTFLDRRRAYFFAVNPFGIQQDGVRTEGTASAGRTFGSSIDNAPDFLFDSRGRLTESGYVVEIRIPFKSLRYPVSDVMDWGIVIERKTQRTGFVDTWPALRRAAASVLAQGATITGLRDLQRGVVFEAQPFVTVNASGVQGATGFERNPADAEPGANARLGFTSFTIDGTVNPDFSQVEADAGQVTVNERFALFFPEKRPFFLEGIELFSTPNQLVYTRRIADPLGGAKVTGKTGRFNVAHLTAVDERADAAGRDALFNITRLRRDVGTSSSIGATFTDRSVLESDDYNRVAAADARLVFGGLYFFEAQLGGSETRRSDATFSDPIWKLTLDRTGRAFGFNYSLNGVGANFVSEAGFVNRTNIVTGGAFHRYTWFGPAGSALERVITFFGANRIWRYDDFAGGTSEGDESINTTARFRGDWQLGARVGRVYVNFDSLAYANFGLGGGAGPAFAPLDRVSAPSFQINANTPVFQRFDANVSLRAGRVAIFAEGGEGNVRGATAAVSLRPGTSVRVSLNTTYESIARVRDASGFARTVLHRVRAEYQPTRSFFLRAIAEYRVDRRAELRDPRSGELVVVDGVASRPVAANGMRADLLASYQPTPGTVAFLGYGAILSEPEAFRFDGLARSRDGLFLKLAYLFRR